MADQLPDEIWLKILGYTCLEDRMRNIQFCSKRFHRLCADYTLTHDLDFSKAVFLPEGKCLDAVNKAREYVSRLSFKGCHWLNSSLFMDLPHLPALETLNIICCFLDVDHILSLLQKVPKLKNLALTLSVEQMGHLRYIKENSTQVWPDIHLERIHIHMYRSDSKKVWYEYRDEDYKLYNYSDWMYNVFFPDRLAECFSVEIHDRHIYYEFGKISRTVADFGREDAIAGLSSDEDCEDFCRFTRKLGMHKLLAYDPSVSAILDLSKVKYMRLQEFRPDMLPEWKCADVLPPDSLPNLEYLLCSWHNEKSDYECYDKLTRGIVFDCELPNLKYLQFTAWSLPPVELYTSLSKMKNLRELEMSGSIDTDLLLQSIQSLSKLESLCIPIPNTHINGRHYLDHLVSAVPNLRKLIFVLKFGKDLSHYFYPMQKLVFLEYLKVYINSEWEPTDVDAFCTVLKKLHRLTTIEFTYSWGKVCYFCDVIHKALKFLPNLIHLTMETKEEPTENILEAVKECKKLEKLWIDDCNVGNPIESSTLIPLLDEVITSLPRLHLIAVCSEGFSENVKESVKKFHEKLKKEGRKTFLYCGESKVAHPFKIPAVLGPIHPNTQTWPPFPLDCF